MAQNLCRVNRSIRGPVASNTIKSFLWGKVDYGSEVTRFSQRQCEVLDRKWHIFIKAQYGIRRSTLNQNI